MHFDPVVHAATPSPTILDDTYRAVFEFKNAIGFVLCLRLVGVNVCAHLAVHGLYGRTPQEPVAERDPVAAQIHESPTPAAIHVPEPGGMRAKMFFALFHQMDLAERSTVGHFLGCKIFGSEDKLLGIEKQDACLLGDINHLLALLDRHC